MDWEVGLATVKTVHDSNGEHVECSATINAYPHLFQMSVSREVAKKVAELILEDVGAQMEKMFGLGC